MNNKLLGSHIANYNTEIKGLSTSKEKNLHKEIIIKTSNKHIYEF